MNLSSQICRLHELHAAGALDDRQFARAKHALLRQHAEGQPTRRKAATGRGRPTPGSAASLLSRLVSP